MRGSLQLLNTQWQVIAPSNVVQPQNTEMKSSFALFQQTERHLHIISHDCTFANNDIAELVSKQAGCHAHNGVGNGV